MPKNVTLERNGEIIYPRTKVENIIDFPEIVEGENAIGVGTTPPDKNTKLWIDTTDSQLDKLSGSQVIQSIQNAIYLLQQKVNKLMLLRTQGIISGKVTDGTLTELGNSAEPQIPDIIAEDEEEYEDVEFPEYAVESEPTVNHVTIKMGTWTEINKNKRFFINGELVGCTNQSTMYIFVNGNFKKVASSSSSPDEPIIDDDTMDTTELQQYLDDLDHISFVPVNDPDNKYTVKVNEYGNLIVYNADNDSVLPTPSSRGIYFPGEESQIGALIINSFYLGGLDKDEHSYQPCSHNYVEIANISYQDINLNGLCLMYTGNDSTWEKLPLWGVIKAQSTFLIRGAQCSVMDVNTTKIKVKTFDMEWYVDDAVTQDRTLIKFNRGINATAAFYLCGCDLEDGNKIYVMDGDNNTKVASPSSVGQLINVDNEVTAYGYVDLVGMKSTFKEKNDYQFPAGQTLDENKLFVRVYTLDPVTQSNAKGVSKRNTRKYGRYIDLRETLIDNAEAYTPKASFEHKNLSFDKHNFDPNKPNTLTCNFGIQATYKDAQHPATRCFTWNSVGYYDEFVGFKKKTDSNGTRVESYKPGLAFREGIDPECIRTLASHYHRIRWETFYGAPMTCHKVMITGLTAGVYEYKVGRSDSEGNPTDYVSKTREFTVKADSDVTSFDFIQTTDQQGANGEEYQVWDLSAKFISDNERIGQSPKLEGEGNYAAANDKDFEFTINTGDICYNGSRPNEGIDYYNGYSYLDDKEEMFTIGNNDLAPIPDDPNSVTDPVIYGMTILGTGRERPDKISHIVADLFYTQEMDPINPPILKGTDLKSDSDKYYRVPSLYSFNYGQFHFISLNSEVRTYYGDNEAADAPTTVTGEFGVQDNGSGRHTEFYQKVEDWMVRDLLIWKNNGSLPVSYDAEHPENHRFDPQNCQKAIVYCHEMPFTILAAETYKDYMNSSTGLLYRETAKASLNRKHAFQFQRLFKIWGIRLVFGGHKHTCSISMPVYDAPANYVPGVSTNDDLMVDLSGADTFNPIIQVVNGDNDPNWGPQAKLGYAIDNFSTHRGHIYNSTGSAVSITHGNDTVTFDPGVTSSANDKPLCRYEIVNAVSAPTYVMCQATGFKNRSNSDTSAGDTWCQGQRGMVEGAQIISLDADCKETSAEDQCYPFYTRFKVTPNSIHVDLQRVAGMYTPKYKAGYGDVNRDMAGGRQATEEKLFRKNGLSCDISLT